MQQSSIIFANLLIAYLLFISLRGELPTYITLLRGGGKEPASSGAGGTGGALGGIGGLADSITGGGDYSNADGSLNVSKGITYLYGDGSSETDNNPNQVFY